MAGHVDSAVLIDAPLDLLWDMTNDVEGWPELFSEYSATEIIDQRGDTIRFRLTMHPDADGNSWSWVSERTPSLATHTVRARRIETGWFRYMHILWSFRETPEGVEMRWIQDFAMKPDSPLDEAAMTARLNRNTSVQMERIKQVVEAAAREAVTTP